MTPAEVFVPHAEAVEQQIREHLIAVRSLAQALKDRYIAMGGDAMGGLEAFISANRTYALVDFTYAMGQADTISEAVKLSNFSATVKVAEAI